MRARPTDAWNLMNLLLLVQISAKLEFGAPIVLSPEQSALRHVTEIFTGNAKVSLHFISTAFLTVHRFLRSSPFGDNGTEKLPSMRSGSPDPETRSMFASEEDGQFLIVKRITKPIRGAVEQRIDAWKKIFTAMEAQDEHLVESWKGEMDNLLIFATLYSAIVTAFVVDSFHLVTPADSTSTPGMLLEIRDRITSYSFSNNFANSTHVLAGGATSSSSPPKYAVRVNTVWFLSLTLSLISAFFGIAIQQWLRHLRIPKHIPQREAIRLRQLRYRGLMRWQVPIIVTVLPALVQVSVVLFLVGLLEYVRNSNRDVALPFTVVSSISLVLFVVVSLFPLIEPSCPYKSPLLHVTWELCWVAVAIATVAVISPLSLLVDCFATKKHARMSRWANRVNQYAEKYLFALQPSTTETSHFWTARETKAAARAHEILDQEALSWALTAGPSIKEISCCLKDLGPAYRTRTVMEWISLKYDGHTDMSRMLSRGTVSYDVLRKVDKHFVDEFKDLLMDVLVTDWDKTEPGRRAIDPDIPHIVMLLWKIAKDPALLGQEHEEYRATFILRLSEICHERKLDLQHEKTFLGWKVTPRVPAVLLFDIFEPERDDKLFGIGEVLAMLRWAAQLSGVIAHEQESLGEAAAMFWFAPQEHIFACSAVALSLLVQHLTPGSNFRSQYETPLGELVDNLATFLSSGRHALLKVLDREKSLIDTDQNALPIVTRRAVVSISESIKKLRDDKILPLVQNGCRSDVVQVHISEIYKAVLNASPTPHEPEPIDEKPAHPRMESTGSEVAALPSLSKEGSSNGGDNNSK
ncbi:hypothetical protein NM688_g9022 [Phlebia brevispora]|uniref:Uncharacterized protein n=1 Tax=Phlebia brevispora TaxID=194682 RepID=A0ACC1RLN5_9APHY|nr:hypothetical protein NM688_g9022 [Phlebia brevispora]